MRTWLCACSIALLLTALLTACPPVPPSISDGDADRDTETLDGDMGDTDDGDITGEGDTPSDVNLTPGFAMISAGIFIMGSPDGNKCPPDKPECNIEDYPTELGRNNTDEAQHQVALTYDFEMMQHEVTQGEWQAAFENNPSYFGTNGDGPECGMDCPVERVNWYEALAYANWLSDQKGLPRCYVLSGCNDNESEKIGSGCTGEPYFYCDEDTYSCSTISLNGVTKPQNCIGYRLPTEAEWEYAARAGEITAFYNGNITNKEQDPHMEQIGWYKYNSTMTHSGGQKVANRWGLEDMSGNVWEWVWDSYCIDNTKYGDDPDGSACGVSSMVFRGGSWTNTADECRSANRDGYGPGRRHYNIGFRLVRTLIPDDGDGIPVDDEDGKYDPCTNLETTDCDDNCPWVANPGQEDEDGNKLGDACDHNIFEWVNIAADRYWMGCSSNDPFCDDNEKPRHEVTMPAFQIMTTEVTQHQYETIAIRNPSYFKECGDDCPVEMVTWHDARAFCDVVGGRLPSEAEWEYSARAGTITIYTCDDNTSSCLNEISWNRSNSPYVTKPVGRKNPNRFGLYDMLGNVWEWTEDCWHGNYTDAPFDGGVWGGGDCLVHPIRGGSWYEEDAIHFRVSNRDEGVAVDPSAVIGFRCARDAIICKDGICRDRVTGLEWQQTPPKKDDNSTLKGMSWDDAIWYCQSLDLQGTDWRLPNISELRTLVRGCGPIQTGGACGVRDTCPSCGVASSEKCLQTICKTGTGDNCDPLSCGNGCFITPELSTYCGTQWSSSPLEEEEPNGYAWNLRFSTGTVYADPKSTPTYLRCVRTVSSL